MTPEEYQRISDVFAGACECADGERASHLDRACGSDALLRSRVEAMLQSDAEGEAFVHDAAVMIRAGVEESMQDDGQSEGAPTRIGHYRIQRKIGEGGMGVVYLAEQDHPRRSVAVKVIRSGVMSRELLRRFEFEAQVLGQLRHPGIAHVYEAGSAESDRGELSYFAMEFVEGPPLDRYARENKLGTRKRLELMSQICDAVQHAHQKGVIHRDLKPGNILVEENGQPKILDFGVARATNADTNTVTLQTDVGQLVGTLPYMSPEQVGGTPDEIDTRSDVYSLGVICFELLTGRLPHSVRDRSIPEAARIIRDEEPTRLSSIDRALRGDVETIVAKALQKDKTRRYPSAAEMAEDIRRYLRDEPIVARPASTMYQLGKFARRNKGLVVAVCAVLLALVGGLISTSTYAFRERRQRRISEARFEDLRSFAQHVIVDYQDTQRNQGETQARKYLSSLAQQYLDELARDSGGLNLAVLADLATAYSVIGDVLGQPNSANLGDPKAAMENYLKSIAISEDLVKRDPDNIDAKRYLAIRYERAGNLHLFEQDYDAALKCYEKSHALKMAIADADPAGQKNLSFSYNKLGDVYIKIDREDEALEMYNRSLDIRRRLAESSPEDEPSQRDYSVGLNRVGDVLMELDRKEEALSRYEDSLARRMERAERQPDNMQARMDAAVGHFKHGAGLAAVGRVDESLAAYRTSRSMLQAMAADDPSNTTARLGAAEMSGQIGNVLLDSGRLEAAIEEFTKQTQEIEAAMPEEKLPATVRELLAGAHQLRGQAMLKLAGGESVSASRADDCRAEGCAALRRANEHFLVLSDDGTAVPEQLTADLKSCDAPGDAER